LAEHLLNKGCFVFGIKRWRSNTQNINHFEDKIKLYEADITDLSSIKSVIDQIKPNYIFHLAAQTSVPVSWKAPQQTLLNNIIGTLNIFEAVRMSKIDPVIHVPGTCDEYGLVHPRELPVKEENPLRPMNPYGVSKVSQEKLALQYHHSYNMKIITTRSFNQTGPRNNELFVCSALAKQIAEIEKNKKKPIIFHGNLEAKRDFTDIRDIVKAYWLAVNKCSPGQIYNICSEKKGTYSISQILNMLISMSKSEIKLKQDPNRMRPSDAPVIYGDCSKFKKLTNWKPEITVKQSLKDLLDYWRKRV